MSLDVDSVFAVPSELTEPQMVASLLAPVLKVDADELRDRFQTMHSFCWVKRRVTPEEAARVRDLNLKGVYFQRETKRFYPKGDLAAQAIGYVGLDDKGLGGIEYALNDADQGQARPRAAGFRRAPPHLSQHRMAGHSRQERGADASTRKSSTSRKRPWRRKWRTRMPRAAWPLCRIPTRAKFWPWPISPPLIPMILTPAPAAARLNRAVGWVYEPGSTFKIDHRRRRAGREADHTPTKSSTARAAKSCWRATRFTTHKPHYVLSVTDMLAESSDVGTIKLALRLGEDRFYRYIRAFGIGSKTGVELPGEERGLLQPPSRWSGISHRRDVHWAGSCRDPAADGHDVFGHRQWRNPF